MKISEAPIARAPAPPVAAQEPWGEEILALYPALVGVHPGLASVLPAQGPLQVPAGVILFNEGQRCPGFPLLLDAEVRITRRSADGHSRRPPPR